MTDAPFQLFPALDTATEAALRESVLRFGVLVPVVRDQHGRTLDGHHRARVADSLGVSFRVDVVTVADDEEALDISRTLNSDRRHMDAPQRREVESALREQGHSFRAIAGALGVSHVTVQNDLRGGNELPPAAETLGRDGKRYPSRRPTVVAAKNERDADRAQVALAETELPNVQVLDVKRVERLAREQAADRRRALPTLPMTAEDDTTILLGDFREVLAEYDLSDSIVITDPPYPREFLNDWQDMAQATLDWGCSRLVSMCGQSILPDALDLIRRAFSPPIDEYVGEGSWVYRWCGAYLMSGPATRVWNAAVGSAWKPILVFEHAYGADRSEAPFVTTDVFRSTGDDKQHHRWGQNEDGIAALVEAFTSPGDLVVDPFLGGGTTAVVCRELGRRFVGCDIDAAAVSATRERLAA